jgi:hypothetical protein
MGFVKLGAIEAVFSSCFAERLGIFLPLQRKRER